MSFKLLAGYCASVIACLQTRVAMKWCERHEGGEWLTVYITSSTPRVWKAVRVYTGKQAWKQKTELQLALQQEQTALENLSIALC